MRVGLVLLCLCSVAAAEPAIPALRPMPKGVSASDAKLWAKFRVAERRGRLVEMYDAMNSLANASSSVDALFNLGVIALRGNWREVARDAFQQYLARASGADKTKVQALIDQMDSVPSAMTFATEHPAAVFLRHRFVGNSPVTLPLAPADYEVEVFGLDTYGREVEQARRGFDDYREISVGAAKGNVFISGVYVEPWKDGTKTFVGQKRFSLPVGKYRTQPRYNDGRPFTCEPFEFEVKSVSELTYVWVQRPEEPDRNRACFVVSKVLQQQVKLP
jgi:hypothetical protein